MIKSQSDYINIRLLSKIKLEKQQRMETQLGVLRESRLQIHARFESIAKKQRQFEFEYQQQLKLFKVSTVGFIVNASKAYDLEYELSKITICQLKLAAQRDTLHEKITLLDSEISCLQNCIKKLVKQQEKYKYIQQNSREIKS